MKLRWLLLALCLWPHLAAGQARIDQLGAAAAVGDTDKFPVCQGCGVAVNAVEATGTQLKTYFNGVYPQRTNNLSDLSNFLLARENLGFPDGTTSTVLHGAAGGAPTYTQVLNADIATNTIAFAKLAQSAANTLLCNGTSGTANITACTLGARLSFSLGVLDIATASITNTYLASGVAATNLGPCAGDWSGSFPGCTNIKVNGASYPASPAVHQVPIVTSAATGGAVTYKTISDCIDSAGSHINYSQSTDTWSCGTTNGVSLTASPGLKLSPTPYVNGVGTISPDFAINQTCKTTNYTLVEGDSSRSLCFSGTNLTLTVNSSASNYLPAGEGFTVSNQDASALTVAIGTGSSIFKNSPGSTTSFTIPTNGWAIVQSDGAGAPNNYWVFPSNAGGGGASGALVKIGSATANNTSQFLSFTGLGSTYNNYKLICDNLIPATTDYPLIQVGSGAGPTWSTSGYVDSFVYTNDGNTTIGSSANGNDIGVLLSLQVNSNVQWGISFEATIYNVPSASLYKHVTYSSALLDSTNTVQQIANGGGVYISDRLTVTGIRFAESSFNVSTGSCTLYGITQ